MEQAKATGIVGWIRTLGRGVGRLFGASPKPVNPLGLSPEDERRLHGRLLRLVMADLSEKYYSARHMMGIENSLWKIAEEGRREDGKMLMYLAVKANGWWVWDELARAEVLVPLDAWKRMYREDELLEPVEQDGN